MTLVQRRSARGTAARDGVVCPCGALLIPGTEVSALAIGVPLLRRCCFSGRACSVTRLPRLAERVTWPCGTRRRRHSWRSSITVLANARRIVRSPDGTIVSGLVVIEALPDRLALVAAAERREILIDVPTQHRRRHGGGDSDFDDPGSSSWWS